MSFKHLSLEERVKIESYLELGMSQSVIAEKIGRSRSTISREINRNSPNPDNSIANVRYFGMSANNVATIRRAEISSQTKLNSYLKATIEEHLNLHWSPEQIAFGLRSVSVCTNTIYNWIYKGVLNFSLKDLRLHGKRYKQHYKGKLIKHRESKMVSLHSIEKRPESVENRREFGHWEVDTVLSSRATNSCLATFLERKTRLYYAIRIKNRDSDNFRVAMDTFTAIFPDGVKSITCDHGAEFINGDLVYSLEHRSNIRVYFAHPYSPHERGANEYHNGLLREYFPKKTNFNQVSAKEIMVACEAINNRPRKSLKWKTANYKFQRELAKYY